MNIYFDEYLIKGLVYFRIDLICTCNLMHFALLDLIIIMNLALVFIFTKLFFNVVKLFFRNFTNFTK